MQNPVKNILSKKHIGATGNLGLKIAEKRIKQEMAEVKKEKEWFEKAMSKLMA